MNCPGCVAFCGGHEHGAFEGHAPQQCVDSLDKLFAEYAGLPLSHSDIVVVQMLFFSTTMGTPTVQEAARWHEHFGLAQQPNHRVLIGPAALRDASYDSVPGYWLIDRDFTVVKDATGHSPRDNLYTELLPAVSELLQQSASARPQ